LIEALGDGESRVRQTAVKALGNIGPAAREAVPAITRAVKRGAWPEAEESLRQIQGRPAEVPTPEAR
jgi:HEAT repeat protein